MALQRQRNHGVIGAHRHLIHPQNLARAARLAGYAGRYLRQRYDEWQNGDQQPAANQPEPDPDDDDGIDYSPTVEVDPSPGTSSDARMGGSASGIGYRGPLTGNTQLHVSYGSHYHEIQELHSKKIRAKHYVWGFKTKVGASDTTTPLWRPADPRYNGVGLWNVSDIGENAFANFSQVADVDLIDYVYSHALNFRLDDFIDNKLLNQTGTAGLMTQYLRFRLKSITVEIVPSTYNGGVLAKVEPLEFLSNVDGNSDRNQEIQIMYMTEKQPHHSVNLDYWVLRDVYNDYTTTTTPFDIPIRPPESNTTTLDNYSRACRSVRNFDTYLTVMNNEKKFSFTREVVTKANYYLTLAQIQALRNQNVQVLINALEGLDGAGGIATALPESFNLLFVPCSGPMALFAQPFSTSSFSGPGVDLNVNTHLYIKTLSTWEAFDFNYGTQQGPLGRDLDIGLTSSIEAMTARILQRHAATSCVQLDEFD